MSQGPLKKEVKYVQNRRSSDFFAEAMGGFDDYECYSQSEGNDSN